MNKKNNKPDKAPFPVKTKLMIIASFVVVLTLFTVTALDTGVFHSDAISSAREKSMEINGRLAAEAEALLSNTRSASGMFVRTALSRDLTANLFWEENPRIAAVCHLNSGRQQTYTNRQVLSSYGITEESVSSYFDGQKSVFNRATGGETILQNASPYFFGQLLTLFYPIQGGGAVGVLFSSDNLNYSFGSAQNQSFMINTEGRILCYSDPSLVKNGTSIKYLDFIQAVLKSPERRSQMLTESDFGIMKAAYGAEDIDVRIWKKIKSKALLLIDRSKEFLAKYDILTLEQKKGKKTRAFVVFTGLHSLDAVVITCTEYDEMFKDIFALIRRNIYIAAGIIIVSFVIVSLFSETLTASLRSLSLASKQIKEGNFKQNVAVKNRDETGVLASDYKKMAETLSVFYRFTNREIAVRMTRGDIKPGGVTKHGSILCSKIRDFSSKMEHFSGVFGFEASGKIINWLNVYFSQMIDCVEKADGIMGRLTGDALTAHWGVAGTAGSPRKDAFNCVKAALMMRKTLFFLNKETRAGDPENPPIYFGCGINSGNVAAGQIGGDKYMEYSAVGDTVNIASEIQGLTEQFGVDILITEDTWRLIGDLFLTDELSAVKVKGKDKPVRLFAVINFTGETKGPQSLDEVRSILCIDAPELEEL